MINSCSLTWVDTVGCHVCLRLQLCQVGRVAMMQCLYDCQRACFWPRARAPSQPFSPPFPLHPPPRCPRPYAWSYCFHCHTISSTTDLFSPALMRRNYLQASNKPRPILHVHTCSRAWCQSQAGCDSAEAKCQRRNGWRERGGRRITRGAGFCGSAHFKRSSGACWLSGSFVRGGKGQTQGCYTFIEMLCGKNTPDTHLSVAALFVIGLRGTRRTLV